jgi:hypothetical protein
MKRYTINLSEEEREELTRLTTSGRHAARKMLHAKILTRRSRNQEVEPQRACVGSFWRLAFSD